jgi:hypothetical protein
MCTGPSRVRETDDARPMASRAQETGVRRKQAAATPERSSSTVTGILGNGFGPDTRTSAIGWTQFTSKAFPEAASGSARNWIRRPSPRLIPIGLAGESFGGGRCACCACARWALPPSPRELFCFRRSSRRSRSPAWPSWRSFRSSAPSARILVLDAKNSSSIDLTTGRTTTPSCFSRRSACIALSISALRRPRASRSVSQPFESFSDSVKAPIEVERELAHGRPPASRVGPFARRRPRSAGLREPSVQTDAEKE